MLLPLATAVLGMLWDDERQLITRIWDIPSLSNTPIMSLDGHTGNVTALQYSAQGKWIVTGSEDGTVKVWDTR